MVFQLGPKSIFLTLRSLILTTCTVMLNDLSHLAPFYLLCLAETTASPLCLTTILREADWTNAGCTWPMKGPPGAGTASSQRRLSFLAGPRNGKLSSLTLRGQMARRVLGL